MRNEIINTAGTPANVSIHEPHAAYDKHVAILYFHGGGLLYGEQDDLPSCYIDMILACGYTLYCFDYPLAPESPLRDIQTGVFDAWRWFISNDFLRTRFKNYVLFGRSAGAYLALTLATHIHRTANAVQPVALIDFYGFYDLTDPFFSEKPSSFTKLPAVGSACVNQLRGQSPTTRGPKTLRFSLYIHVRQTGTWQLALGLKNSENILFSCSEKDIASFPPIFITASTTDEDVPYRISKTLFRKAPHTYMKTVYNLEHDFDRDTTNPIGREVYTELLTWLDEITST